MGGIFAITCKRAVDGSVIYEGLRRLTYRGYDSVGLAYLEQMRLRVRKALGSAENNRDLFKVTSDVMLGHTRYATRGWPTVENAHPLLDCKGKVAVVMDGIIDGYEALRSSLSAKGHRIVSTTDTEVIAHMIEDGAAPAGILRSVPGTYAAAFIREGEGRVWFVQNGQPLVIGLSSDCKFLASDRPSLYGLADEAIVVPERSYGFISADSFAVYDVNGNEITAALERKRVKHEPVLAERGGYPHYMLKEIYETPDALIRTVHSLMDKYLRLSAMIIYGARRVFIIGNGTSLHAGMVSAYYFTDLGGVSVNVVSAAEFPYYALDSVTTGTVVVAISQSGETSDVIRSVKMAKQRGAVIVGVLNTLGSRLALESNVYLPIGAGPELAVPATKTFTSTLAATMLLASYVGLMSGRLSQQDLNSIYSDISSLAKFMASSMEAMDAAASKVADSLKGFTDFYVASSGITYPVALEAALKLKEAALSHAEGVQLGELRHGPMVLVRQGYPVILVRPQEEVAQDLYERVLADMIARGATVVEVSRAPGRTGLSLPTVEYSRPQLAPIAAVVPLQLLAYRVGVAKGAPIDSPPGLAKAITT